MASTSHISKPALFEANFLKFLINREAFAEVCVFFVFSNLQSNTNNKTSICFIKTQVSKCLSEIKMKHCRLPCFETQLAAELRNVTIHLYRHETLLHRLVKPQTAETILTVMVVCTPKKKLKKKNLIKKTVGLSKQFGCLCINCIIACILVFEFVYTISIHISIYWFDHIFMVVSKHINIKYPKCFNYYENI